MLKGDGSLGIPTELSPVKDVPPAVSQSILGRVASALSFGSTSR